ncbi:hypothetical protein nACB1_071 [Acinetobacter phage nACB1]|nr:hypothetical protein nACB1_071 [Acinetobacter phage nACB1]
MFTSNFSDRFKKTMSGFQKAFDELTVLKADISTETKAANEHLAKLEKAANQVDSALTQLKPFVSGK